MTRALYLALLSVWMAIPGCAHDQQQELRSLVLDAFATDAPVIDVIVEGREAEWARKQCEGANGAQDTSACNLGRITFYFGHAAFEDQELRRHECVHSAQGRARGYVVQGLLYYQETKDKTYDTNRYEVEARERALDPKAPTSATDCR